MKIWPAIAALALLGGTAGAASAQGPEPLQWPRPIVARAEWPGALGTTPLLHAASAGPRSTRPVPAGDSTAIPPTHWKAGALLGGGFLGLLGALTFSQLCSYDGPCEHPVLSAVGGFALGGVIGFGIGALIGGQFPAHTP